MPKIVSDEDVFAAVIQAVVDSGYAATTVKQIAEAANTSEATLFRKYGSKEQLLIQAVQAHVNNLDIDSIIRYTGDIAADLRHILEFFMAKDKDQKMPFLITIAAELGRFPELRGLISAPDRAVLAIGRLMAQYQADGVLAPEHPVHAVATFIGPIVMMQTVKRTKPEFAIPQPDIADYVNKFLHGRLA